jgi:voltage-gated potassium channel
MVQDVPDNNFKEVLYEIIFEADTPAGKWFDVLLILSILVSVAVVMADSIGAVRASNGPFLTAASPLNTFSGCTVSGAV